MCTRPPDSCHIIIYQINYYIISSSKKIIYYNLLTSIFRELNFIKVLKINLFFKASRNLSLELLCVKISVRASAR